MTTQQMEDWAAAHPNEDLWGNVIKKPVELVSCPQSKANIRFVIEYREEDMVGVEYEPIRASTAQEAYSQFMELYPGADVINVLVPAFHGDGSDYFPPLPR